MNGLVGAGVAGAVAGIGVAMPLGAVGVMLVRESITAGWRVAAGGAAGVALVDGFYAAVAVLAGAAVTAALQGHERQVQVGGALLLAAVAVRGLLTTPGVAADVHETTTLGAALRFLAITLVNPLTAVYFVALAAGGGELLDGADRRSVFVAGVLTTSMIWQLVLVLVGALAGTRMGPRTQRVTSVVGYLVVLAYAVKLGA